MRTIGALAALMAGTGGESLAAGMSADFTREIGPIRRELHSSGFGPQICSCPQQYIDDIKSMGFFSSRTHDWALINPNQRVCDYFHLFPLMHLDAKDRKNYVFAPTDYLLKRTREEIGHDVFFRLGTSIEHSGKVHFNALIPEDFDKVAEIFAGTVRHYNRGWAGGYEWGIKYWEIWNEPDGLDTMWCMPGGDEGCDPKTQDELLIRNRRRALFTKFFVICLKRLKSEFPDIFVGGPAMCDGMNEPYFRAIFEACKTAGVKPDFISWHHYAEDPQVLARAIERGRMLCDEYGFTKCELVINEWHYFSFSDYDWNMLRSPDSEVVRKIWGGPRSHNGIDSSCFNLACLSMFQTSKLDQGFYYGCQNIGDWGYMDESRRKYKVFYGLRLFGDFVRKYSRLCAATGDDPEKDPVITVLPAKSADGRSCAVLVSDYRVRTREMVLDIKGVPENAKVEAWVHDQTHDFAPADFRFEKGRLVLRKVDEESAAFMVEFKWNPSVKRPAGCL